MMYPYGSDNGGTTATLYPYDIDNGRQMTKANNLAYCHNEMTTMAHQPIPSITVKLEGMPPMKQI